MLPDLPYEQLLAAMDAVVVELLDAAGIDTPPVDSLELARRLDIDVARDDQQRGRARFVRLAGRHGGRSRASILVRAEPRNERRQWAVAHELGEWSAARLFAELGTTASEAPLAAREEVANLFAARLLLPELWFVVAAEACDMELVTLKESFRTASYELIARRTLDLSAPAIVTVFDQGNVTWRRSNVVANPPALSSAERVEWRTTHESASYAEGISGLGRLRCWPIHEEGWRREILRQELEAEL
ncbi:MAG: ImmA/IrrE family metallo-endopeptidase [Pirellulales bacterium]|nr:ImmA/IrrE family metallo-endopeptidase [Pirellulales bacterium]